MLSQSRPQSSTTMPVTLFNNYTYCHVMITGLFVDESLSQKVVSRFAEVLLLGTIGSTEELFIGHRHHPTT